MALKKGKKAFPVYGWAGLLFIAAFWPLNWHVSGLRTHWGFFPLWLGYILLVNGLCHWHKSHSLLSRDPVRFLWLFVISAPVWWLFELMDHFTNYWIYLGRQHFSDLEFFLLASLSFTTVIPAVFSTAELAGTWQVFKNIGKKGPRIAPVQATLVIFLVIGILMLAAVILWPHLFVPFLWMALYFILEPINYKLGYPTLLEYTQHRNWQPVLTLWAGALICGFFWEMWNIYSYPKWIYELPYLDQWHIFEMPLVGYLGYLPFALELYALYQFITGIFDHKKTRHYVRVLPEE